MSLRRFVTWPRVLVACVLVIGATFAALWLLPSGQYLLLPGEALPVSPLVSIGDRETRTPTRGSGIYMVDILLRKANLLEEIFPSLNSDATLVPDQAINPVGVSEQQREQSGALDMTRSERIAAAVALESLGYDVKTSTSGAEVSLVVPDSPAAGVLQPGDIIVRANGQPVKTTGELRDAMAEVKPGQPVAVEYRRAGKTTEVTLSTRAAEDDPSRAVIGVLVDQAASIDLPVPIKIDAGSIIGPSAGLAFALDIVDQLGPDVDKGRRIVATGELGLDGSVEPIGGVKQKAIGAKEAGADVFIVPQGNYDEAKRYSNGLRIVPVKTFDEALADLGATPVTS